MAGLFPFRALRPAPAAAARVAAVPYDVVTADEARALAAGEPLSFLHVSRAEIDLAPDTDPHADLVYETAARRFERLKADAPFVRDEAPALYLYGLQMAGHRQLGVAGCYALDEYDRGIVKKHERTRRDKEDDRTHHMLALGAQTGPVFLTYRASEAIDGAAARAAAGDPLYDFEAADGVRHTVWRLAGAEREALVSAFSRVPALYIADGHHRAASAARARGTLRDRAHAAGRTASTAVASVDATAADRFLAVAFPDNQVQILPYNRIVRDLNGLSPPAFLEAAGARFDLSAGRPTPPARGVISMHVAGRWYALSRPAARPAADPLRSLDVSVLQEELLAPVLGIVDVRTDPRIEFVGGARGPAALERAVAEGRAAVAFSMFPVSIAELMAIADAGDVMPPKSTWFEPKLRDGLLVHEISS